MISVYNYEDPIHYVSDFLALEKKMNKEFSFKKWVQDLGMNSSAPMVEILKRQRPLKPSMVALMIDHIGLDKSEYLYFLALVAKVKSSSAHELQLYDLVTHNLSPRKENEVYCAKRFEQEGIFSHWIYTTIFTMTALRDFEVTALNVQKALKENLPLDFIESAIMKLLELGLLEEIQGRIQRKYVEVSTKNDSQILEVKNYYSQMADLAKTSTDLPLEEREFQSFSMSVTKEQLPLLKNIIRECKNKMASLSNDNGDEVYQMNMFFSSMTEYNKNSPDQLVSE